MLNKKRQGFTLMEIVLVMVLIAILATGVAIGFTSYINRGHETGITTDFNSTFQNPIRMTAIEKGRIVKVKALTETVLADGFSLPSEETKENWTTAAGEVTTVAVGADQAAINTILGTFETSGKAFVEKGNKRYIIESIEFDASTNTETEDGAAAIKVTADHSSKRTTAIFVLNEAKNDVITVLGTSAKESPYTFTPDGEFTPDAE